MAARGPGEPQARPEVGDILLVIHDFLARSSDELSLAKGDKVELVERDDEFGDGWFLGKHLVNGNSGLFPEVYTRPAPKSVSLPSALPAPKPQAAPPPAIGVTDAPSTSTDKPTRVPSQSLSSQKTGSTPITLPLSSAKPDGAPNATSSVPPPVSNIGAIGRLNTSQDSQVLNETLHVINEHITDLRSPQSIGALRSATTDSGSEYSSHIDHRMSYIHGEETDEEEDDMHTRSEVESWTADDVAEYLFTSGVEKQHCEVFRDQEISGEVLLGMDQAALFLKAFDLGSVGRRLKTWQKIKNLQDEVNGEGLATRRTTQTYGSDVGSDAGKGRSRANTLTNSMSKLAFGDERPLSTHAKRTSVSRTPRLEPTQPVSPLSSKGLNSPGRSLHEKRPSAASVRELHHSRRHSSTGFSLTEKALATGGTPPKLATSGTFPLQESSHKKQPSFDRNWTLGSAAPYSQRPLSSTGLQDLVAGPEPELQDSAVDLDRGYFSGTEVDGRRRNVLRKRDSNPHSRKSSYADEQRMRSATAMSRHSRLGSVDSAQGANISAAASKYYGVSPAPHRRTISTATTESYRPPPPAKDNAPPVVTKLDSINSDTVRSSPQSPVSPSRQMSNIEWPSSSKSSFKTPSFGLRAISDAVTGQERSKLMAPVDSPLKESPMQSPARTGSSTPSGGPSLDLDSPDTGKSLSTVATPASRNSKKKKKKETSAYTRGLQTVTPREAMLSADYSGWMKKRSSNLMTTWKPRLFVLQGRRLAYYYSEDDEQEKGLIDISFHRVLPADNEKLTGLHATLTGAGTTPAIPAGSNMATLAETQAEADSTKESEAMFIFKLVPPRAGLSRAVNFTKPTVHYFAVPNIKQGRLWMAALMKATIDRDDAQPITTTYQQKTISLAKARAMRHRPPALMNLDEQVEEAKRDSSSSLKKDSNGLGITFGEGDSGVSGIEKMGLHTVESTKARQFPPDVEKDTLLPQSA